MTEAASEPVRTLEAKGIEYRLHLHTPTPTVAALRADTEFDIERSVKALAFAVGDDAVLLAAVPGPARIRYGALAAAAGVPRSRLAPADSALLAELGMEPGGVTPICADTRTTLVFDRAIPEMGRVFCGSGRADQTVEVQAADLLRIGHRVLVADIATAGAATAGAGPAA